MIAVATAARFVSVLHAFAATFTAPNQSEGEPRSAGLFAFCTLHFAFGLVARLLGTHEWSARRSLDHPLIGTAHPLPPLAITAAFAAPRLRALLRGDYPRSGLPLLSSRRRRPAFARAGSTLPLAAFPLPP